MVAASAPMPPARTDTVPAVALARLPDAPAPHGYATVRERLVAARGESWLRLWLLWWKAMAK